MPLLEELLVSEAAAQPGDSKQGKKSGRLPSVRGWFVLIILFALSAGYFYVVNLQKQEFFLNSFHFRTLQEVAGEFNNKLEQLVNLHKYCESRSTISAIFPSYESEDGGGSCVSGRGDKDLTFTLETNRLQIKRGKDQIHSSIDIIDVLPLPREGFALYLIVDDNNSVLSSTAAASGLSMIDARAVSRAVQLRESEDWAQLARQVPSAPAVDDKPLPGHSTFVDLGLNTGKSRIFILPFLLHNDIVAGRSDGASNGDDATGSESGGGPLYLLGVQPQQAIEAYENSRWNMSLLLLSLVFLMAVWLGTRLLMLSRHQPIGTYFYSATIVASYLTFLLLVALILAYAQREAAVAERQSLARATMMKLDRAVNSDLRHIIEALDPYHDTYGEFLNHKANSTAGTSLAGTTPGSSLPVGCADDTASGWPCLLFRIAGKEEKLELRIAQDVVSYLLGDGGKRVGTPTVLASGDSRGIPRFTEVNVYPPQARVALSDDGKTPSEWFDLTGVGALPGAGRLLSVFLMNDDAWQILPGFFFYETNKPPISYHLSHRHYFRRVRDQQAWELDLAGSCQREGPAPATSDEQILSVECPAEPKPVRVSGLYLQRLLNINTGTRGTTLGMPLHPADGADTGSSSQPRYILGADIDIPSLSFAPWDRPVPMQDMLLMVVDRRSGQVLYHMDADREMVENLYEAGRSTAEIGRLIQSQRPVPRAVSGHYHGAPGKFLSADLPVSEWATVVFIPDASTKSLMTNAFLANAGGMLALLLVIAVLLHLWLRFSQRATRAIDGERQPAIAFSGMLEFAAILIASTYAAFRLGAILEDYGAVPYATALCVPVAVAAVLLWVRRQLQRFRRASAQEIQPRERGMAAAPLLSLLLAAVAVWAYLSYVGDEPRAALDRYYAHLFEARLNQERDEYHDIALTRFPNTIREHGADPLTLLPLNSDWRSALSAGCFRLPDGGIRGRHKHVTPDDIGTFSQYSASTNAFDWVLRHLLGIATTPITNSCGARLESGTEPGVTTYSEVAYEAATLGPGTTAPGTARHGATLSLARFTVVVVAVFLLLCAVWYRAHGFVVTARLTGSTGLLEHLRYILSRNRPAPAYAPREDLVLDVQRRHYAGENLAALVHRQKRHDAPESTERDEAEGICHAGVTLLLEECPWLWEREGFPENLRGLHIAFERSEHASTLDSAGDDGNKSIEVHLSKLDSCLGRATSRAELLRFVKVLRGLCEGGRLAALRISLDFHSYESLLLKAHSTQSDRDALTAAESADWAATFVDFSVDLPEQLIAEIDTEFLVHECGGSNLLTGLIDEVSAGRRSPPAQEHRRTRWLSLQDGSKTAREWATINYILLKAGALFRHKWESCSGAEKLAIFQLARRRRINMANGQLLEQLALQGLIRIDGNRVRIVNNSLAYFARHAEDTEALRELVEIGESGVWQQYRLPITLVILLLLAGIALTSGSSLYLVAASLLGLLGTIGSLTSSAQLIRENLR